MNKYIVSFSLSLITVCILLLANCAEQEKGPNNNHGQPGGSSFGFTPGSPTSDSLDSTSPDSSYGFDVTVPRGVGSSTVPPPSTGGPNRDPLYKSQYVLNNERSYGTSAPVTITDISVFEDFRWGELINRMDDIEDLRVYVKLSKANENRYAGEVRIAYYDHARTPNARVVWFSSGTGDNARYNVWFKKNGKDAFHGFFQENGGSIVLVVDSVTPVVDNPDGSPITHLYSGSIWTMQFRMTWGGKTSCNNHDNKYVPTRNIPNGFQPLSSRNKQCWFITTGPFDCRTWRDGNGVDTFRAIHPDDSCYQKMGTFMGLDILKAFGVNNISEIAVHQK